MLFAYRPLGPRLERLAVGAPLSDALWIDLYKPLVSQVEHVAELGIPVPTLEDMEEIEISNRLYREDGLDFLTVVLPGMTEMKEQVAGPVTFILAADRIVTVRHHVPRPFETYPDRAEKVSPGCGDPQRIFLSLMEEIVGRLADHLEGAGRELDLVARSVYSEGASSNDKMLLDALRRVGRESDMIGRVRLSLLTLERALGFFTSNQGTKLLGARGGAEGAPADAGEGETADDGIDAPRRDTSPASEPGPRGKAAKANSEALRVATKALLRDIQSLEVHADFLGTRVAMASDAALGIINLAQAHTIKIFSVLAVVFLPPTVIASAYGMNFDVMPELHWTWGYPMALVLMLLSAVGTYAFFKWRKLL
jgi:magnesium transporter